MNGQKPGYKTTEFWMTVLVDVLGLIAASGIIADGSIYAKIFGMICTTLATLGYTISRGTAKSTNNIIK